MDFFTSLAENFDIPILDFVAEHLHTQFFDALMPIVTLFGEAGIFWILCAVALLFIPRYRKAGLGMGIALLIGLIVCNITLKPLIARPRPFDYLLSEHGKAILLLISPPSDFSFPSGHTLASFEAATVLLLRERKFGIPALILAVLVAFSRIYLYVHYPTDVLFALVLGVGIGFLGNFLAEKLSAVVKKQIQKKKSAKENRTI